MWSINLEMNHFGVNFPCLPPKNIGEGVGGEGHCRCSYKLCDQSGYKEMKWGKEHCYGICAVSVWIEDGSSELGGGSQNQTGWEERIDAVKEA